MLLLIGRNEVWLCVMSLVKANSTENLPVINMRFVGLSPCNSVIQFRLIDHICIDVAPSALSLLVFINFSSSNESVATHFYVNKSEGNGVLNHIP